MSTLLKYDPNLEKTGVNARFLPDSANQFVNILLCSKLKLRSFRDVKVPFPTHFEIPTTDTGGMCIYILVSTGVWISIWAAVDGLVRES